MYIFILYIKFYKIVLAAKLRTCPFLTSHLIKYNYNGLHGGIEDEL